MTGWFEIRGEPHARLVRLTMGGFFARADVARVRAAFVETLATLRCAPNDHTTLCDITQMNIQSQEIVTAFAALVGSPDVRSRRLAFVTGPTLARLQAQRLTDRPGVGFFGDIPAALAWLREEEPRATDATPLRRSAA